MTLRALETSSDNFIKKGSIYYGQILHVSGRARMVVFNEQAQWVDYPLGLFAPLGF